MKYRFRQHSGAEVDLVLEIDGRYFPIEIKSGVKVSPKQCYGVMNFTKIVGDRFQKALVIYGGDRVLQLSDQCFAVPFDAVISK